MCKAMLWIVDWILRLRWWNLTSKTYYVWIQEEGREWRRSYQVLRRDQRYFDSWIIRTDAGSYFYNYRGLAVRRALIRKQVIEL